MLKSSLIALSLIVPCSAFAKALPADLLKHLKNGVFVSSDSPDPLNVRAGKWELTIEFRNLPALVTALEITPTPSCTNGFAVAYKHDSETGIEPAIGRRGALSFGLVVGGRRYLTALSAVAGDENTFEGIANDFLAEKDYPAKLRWVGDGAAFQIDAINAHMNVIPQPLSDHPDETRMYVRAPQLGVTPGDLAQHSWTTENFVCYALNASGSQRAFAYSNYMPFIVLLSDLGGQPGTREKLVWYGVVADTIHKQEQPFLISYIDRAHQASLDIVRRP